MWKHIAANGISFLIVVLIAAAAALGWGQRQWQGEGPLAQATFFEVEQGDTLSRVSERLEAAGAIRSATVFRVGVRAADRAGDLRFGNYEIPAGANMAQVLEIVTAGGPSSFRYRATYVLRNSGTGQLRLSERNPTTGEVEEIVRFAYEEGVPVEYATLVDEGTPMLYRLVIPEGLTSWQVVQGLMAADFLDGEIVDIPPEGMLAPTTIEVNRADSRLDLLAEMQTAQERILAEAWANRAEGIPISTPEEALILASIIEKETSVPEERGRVASVFTNRLNQGMRLQTDPTVIYGVTNGRGILGRGLRQSELRAETPWNTYVINGLPPTPIANPGQAAIEAAVNPDSTDFIFFVADGTGGHAFAVTLDEHNRNVARWREIEAERNGN
ncbi:endolytic transglycosylase MltG [Rhodobacteraceae bacterium N5(2021)]|uniref:Endolytic murein transglycosylase n=1 Tax=Gymnodinialimonas phycosphaerae TaxID=2841589 RepID=A0A975TW01_9RHOB|nr:endolytic transglycosylase MltG [Gymnodinialimonas phycosphaerae]MBY4891449.1 endolytic transglycosylase MltG [Gymnodinialimonas phycosphaerae]